MQSNQSRVVLVTTPVSEAERIAAHLVEKQYAACVNIIANVTSVYRWEGAVHQDTEALLVIKTTDSLMETLEAEVKKVHPYDTPEFVALTPQHVEQRYLKWLGEAVVA